MAILSELARLIVVSSFVSYNCFGVAVVVVVVVVVVCLFFLFLPFIFDFVSFFKKVRESKKSQRRGSPSIAVKELKLKYLDVILN